MRIAIIHLYPDLLNLYGDQGNIECLVKRCQWRNIEVEVIPITIGSQPQSEIYDLKSTIIFMGGGEDTDQKLLYEDFLINKWPWLKEYIKNNGVGLFICGGLQMLGHYYQPYDGVGIPGLGVIDLHTQHFGRDKKRCVGNVSTKIIGIKELENKIIVGFENHGGRTYLGKNTQPLGRVIVGSGNNSEDKTEGIVYKNTIGTYLHGPLLPKNPHLADWLIKTALEQKYKKEVALIPLDDTLEWEAHNQARHL